jgi:hypothetical protein
VLGTVGQQVAKFPEASTGHPIGTDSLSVRSRRTSTRLIPPKGPCLETRSREWSMHSCSRILSERGF